MNEGLLAPHEYWFARAARRFWPPSYLLKKEKSGHIWFWLPDRVVRIEKNSQT